MDGYGTPTNNIASTSRASVACPDAQCSQGYHPQWNPGNCCNANQNQQNPTPCPAKFDGGCEDLKGYIFEYEAQTQVDTYIKMQMGTHKFCGVYI